MESLGLRCGKSFSFRRGLVTDEQPWTSCFPAHHHRHHQQQPMKKKQKSTIKPIQMTRACAKNTIDPLVSSPSSSSSSSSLNSKKWKAGKLDEWMRDSVTEIVRNIGEAPFLAHVYSPTAKETTRLELERETDSWPAITRRWEEGCPIPDGVILVEQLGQQQQEEEATSTGTGTRTRAWGVLIQGKGVDTAACYILKTCRVWSSLGFCTHFCLVKAKCFGETAELQLQNSWNGIN